MASILEELEGINTMSIGDMKSIEEFNQKLNALQKRNVFSFAKFNLGTEYIPEEHVFVINLTNNHHFIKNLRMDFLLPAKADMRTEPNDTRGLTEIFDDPIPYMRAVLYGTGGDVFAEYTTRVVNLRSLFKVMISTAVKMGSDYAQAFMDNVGMSKMRHS